MKLFLNKPYHPGFKFILQIYELLLYYTRHSDHNVVTASLETLQQLLKAAPQTLLKILTTEGSITSTSIYEEDVQQQGRGRSGSKCFNSYVRKKIDKEIEIGMALEK